MLATTFRAGSCILGGPVLADMHTCFIAQGAASPSLELRQTKTSNDWCENVSCANREICLLSGRLGDLMMCSTRVSKQDCRQAVKSAQGHMRHVLGCLVLVLSFNSLHTSHMSLQRPRQCVGCVCVCADVSTCSAWHVSLRTARSHCTKNSSN